MDPLSITASAAGIVSFSFQLFAGCVQGFILLSTAQNIGKDASTIICMLNLQEIHLIEWARAAGLLDGDIDRRLNSKVIEEVLQLLQSLLTDTEKLKKRYKLDLVPATTQVTGENHSGSQFKNARTRDVSAGISDEIRESILLRAGLIKKKSSLQKRLWWAAVDKERIEKLVELVNVLVKQLWMLLDHERQDNLLKSTQTIASNMIALVDRFDQLKSLNNALQHLSNMQDLNRFASTFKSLAKSADIKALKVGLEDQENTQDATQLSMAPSRKVLLQSLERLSRNQLQGFQPMRKRTDMGIARYEDQVVFVEWKEINPYVRKKILPRVDNLAALLNLPKDPTFRSLHCRGTIEVDGKIAFIYAPPGPLTTRPPKSLYDLFSAKEGIEPPSLTARIQLALCIAQSIRGFHRSGWLHKDIRSENIIFFPDRNEIDNSNFNMDSPILAGFSFSRFASPSEISEQPSADPQRDIYRHPHAMGEASLSFNAFMDLYSLGNVLLEIAEWRGLKFLVQSVVNVDDDTVPLSKIAQVQDFLLGGKGKGGTSKLKTKMGDIYNEVCMQCLAGETSDGANATTKLDSIIELLESCKV